MISLFAICNGVIRSGSTWSFNVCRLLADLQSKKRSEHLQCGYLDEKQLEQFIATQAFVTDGSVIIKAHATGPLASEWIRTGKAKAITTIRDPRDCVASDLVFMGSGFEKAVQRVASSFKRLEQAQNFGRALFIRYEDMMSDRLAQIWLVAAHLNIRLQPQELKAVDDRSNLAASREQAGKVSTLSQEQVSVIYENHRVDKMTLLHSNHIGNARPGRWRKELTDGQVEQVTRLFANVLLIFGYETTQSIRRYLPDFVPPISSSENPCDRTPVPNELIVNRPPITPN